MITTVLIDLYDKELDKLEKEISLYESDEQLWKIGGDILNSGGNLCLHLTGNLQHFIGATLGDSGYIRNRDAEFKLKNIPKQKLLEEIANSKRIVTDTLEQISKKELDSNFPITFLDEPKSTEYILVFFLSHLSYHIGQINYHRRLVK
ncbi:DUF1572 family protein [Pollutibacter soli]|uniref:DUF1572 family protein n=1 Tax=Pollutibacter soli TaxID=3034157 RepID=UPI00301344E3